MTEELFNAKLEAARQRFASMDTPDQQRSHSPKVILSALECGIKHPESDAIFNAVVMLEDAIVSVERLRGVFATPPRGE